MPISRALFQPGLPAFSVALDVAPIDYAGCAALSGFLGGLLFVQLVDQGGHAGLSPIVIRVNDQRTHVTLVDIHEGGGGGLDGDTGKFAWFPWECWHAE